jgi:cell division ATPase FtsA
MSLFGSSKENTLLIDIASGSVAVSIINNQKDKVPEIEFSQRLTFDIGNENSQSIEARMLQALKNTLITASKVGVKNLKAKGHPTNIDKVLVSFTSLWFVPKLITRTIEDNKGIRLTQTHLNSLLKKEEEDFKKDLKEAYKEENEVFECEIIGVSANGYHLDNWINKLATSFEITFLLSGTTKGLVRNIEDLALSTFGIKKGIATHSITSILSKIISHSFPNIHSALLVDLSGETTTLLFIHEKVGQKKVMIPFGTASLIRKISENLILPIPIAESSLSLYIKDLLNEDSIKDLNKVFKEAEEEWALPQTLNPHTKEFGIPQNIFLITDTKYGDVGKVILKDIFPDKEIILLDCQNGFVKECIKNNGDNQTDGHLAILGAFSQMIF